MVLRARARVRRWSSGWRLIPSPRERVGRPIALCSRRSSTYPRRAGPARDARAQAAQYSDQRASVGTATAAHAMSSAIGVGAMIREFEPSPAFVHGAATGEPATIEVALELVLHERRQRVRAQERGEVRAQDRVQRAPLRVERARVPRHALGGSKGRYTRGARDSRRNCPARWRSGGGVAAERRREGEKRGRGARGRGAPPGVDRGLS